jgi:hypothetical protein
MDICEIITGGGRIGTMETNANHGYDYGPLAPNMTTQFNVVGEQWEATSGWYFYVNGSEYYSINDDNCSSLNPCRHRDDSYTELHVQYAVTAPQNLPNLGLQLKWVRFYTHHEIYTQHMV